MTWLSQNGLALYGAITGTAALAISWFGHRHNVKKDAIKLNVLLEPHADQQQNLERLRAPLSDEPSEHVFVVEVFSVTVRNLGSIAAPLEDVGVRTRKGKKVRALLPYRWSHGTTLRPFDESESVVLEPRAARTFSVYLNRDDEMFDAVEAYAVDQTGKTWSARA